MIVESSPEQVSDSRMLPLNCGAPMRTDSRRRSAAQNMVLCCRERRAEQHDVGHVRERHVFVSAVDRTPSRVRVIVTGACAPAARSLPALARISESRSMARSSSARRKFAGLHQGSGTHRNAHSG